MTHCVSDHLDQFYDVTRVDLRMELGPKGWAIWEIHRHETGQMGRCQPASFEFLSYQEALDVIDALCSALLPPRARLGPPPSS